MFEDVAIDAKELAAMFVSGVLKERALAADPKPPCAGGSKPMWNVSVKGVLQDMGTRFGYRIYLEWCRLDVMWWANQPERMVLAAESEMTTDVRGAEEDFEKLPSYKCRIKLLVFSADVETVKRNAEFYLERFSQHIKDEQYLLVGFTASGARCFQFRVPRDGKLDDVKFSEFQVAQGDLAAA